MVFLLFSFKKIKVAYQNQSLILKVPGVHRSSTSRNSLGYNIFWVGHRVPMSLCFWLKGICSLRKSLFVRKLVPSGSQAWWWQGCAWFSFIWSVSVHRILSCSGHSYKQGNPGQCSTRTNEASWQKFPEEHGWRASTTWLVTDRQSVWWILKDLVGPINRERSWQDHRLYKNTEARSNMLRKAEAQVRREELEPGSHRRFRTPRTSLDLFTQVCRLDTALRHCRK